MRTPIPNRIKSTLAIAIPCIFVVCLLQLAALAQAPTVTKNYIVETVVKAPGKKTVASLSALPVDSANRTVSYLDGLGRPLQTVQWQASSGKKDVVVHHAYDGYGRETKSFLPYAEQFGNDGSYRATAAANQGGFYGGGGWDPDVVRTPYPFSQAVLEASPMNRVLEQGAPGTVWQPGSSGIANAGHTVKMGYGTNVANEARLWTTNATGATGTAYYPAGKLFRNISRDENWTSGKIGTVEEFRDFEGRIVLKRTWETEVKSLSTYYLYDVYGSLRYVLPPAVNENGKLAAPLTSFSESDDAFGHYIYGYKYDGRKRLIEKKVPGRGWEYMVYNRLDQLAYHKDSRQHAAAEWGFIKYDALGRVVSTGIEIGQGAARQPVQDVFDAHQGLQWEARTGTGPEGYTLNVFPMGGEAHPNVEYHTISYYDDYGFPGYSTVTHGYTSASVSLQVRGLATATRTRILGTDTFLLTVMYYDAEGRVVETVSDSHLTGGRDRTVNTYSFAGELTASTRTHMGNGATTTIANTFSYDHVGRKVSTRSNINGQGWTTLNRLDYNEVGQLKKRQLHSTDGTSFLQSTSFSYNERGWLKRGISPQFGMELKYHNGTSAQYNGNISAQRWGADTTYHSTFNYTYDRLDRLVNGTSTGTVAISELLAYDVMGNISTLARDGGNANQYHYNGNQLWYAAYVTNGYAYDANGNATTDGRRGISLTYNHLNLPVTANKTGLSLVYTYDATGRKVKKVSTTTATTTTDYVEGVQYTNGAIDFIQTEEGRAVRNGTNFVYEYNLTDHLGNVRYVFNRHPTTGAIQPLQTSDYYPFGKRFGTGGTNNYLYNGKELQEGLEQYDYGARFYDAEVGRWNVVDPLAEKFYSINPYNFTDNNPVNNIDPNGMETYYGDEAREVLAGIVRNGLSNDDDEGKKKKKQQSMFSGAAAFYDELKKGDPFGNVGRTWRGWLGENSTMGSDLGNGVANLFWSTASLMDSQTYIDYYENAKNYWEAPLEEKFRAEARSLNNLVEGFSTTAPLGPIANGIGIAKKSAFSLNSGYGVFGEKGLKVFGYQINGMYAYEETPGGTIFSVKQKKIGGNLLRWDYGLSHTYPKTKMVIHSSFRFNIKGNTYGSTAQYSPWAPFKYWKHKK